MIKELFRSLIRTLLGKLVFALGMAIFTGLTIGWFSGPGLNGWRDPTLLYNWSLNQLQWLLGDDEKIEAFVFWTGNINLEIAWAQSLLRSRGPNGDALQILERARLDAPDRPDILLVEAYARAADGDCNGLRLAKSYAEMCRAKSACVEGGVPQEVYRQLSWCRRPKPGEDETSAAQTVVGSLRSCRELYMEHSDDEARSLCAVRAESGDATAAFDLAVIYEAGFGVDRDRAQSQAWFDQAATAGQVDSLAIYGSTIYHGRMAPRQLSRGWKMLHDAADAGSAAAMYSLGKAFHDSARRGPDGRADHLAAQHWLSRAAEHGHPNASQVLAREYPEAGPRR